MTVDGVARLLQEAKHVVVFTGAGASADSGIPTFRDALTGLWERFAPSQLATREAYLADPGLCWGWYEWRRRKVTKAQPNDAHRAIAELANHVQRLTVVTQNVDDLHERAGSKGVIHLHGSLHSPRCQDCGVADTSPLPSEELPEEGARIEPPRCDVCGGTVRPAVVWFGEMLPEEAWGKALAAADDCDFFLSVGTSGIVYPAAELPLRALGRGATIAHVNPARFEISGHEHFLEGRASEMLPALLSAAFPSAEL